jgi:hypothetical protein
MAIWRVRIACWIPKATNTRSEYVTLIAFLRQPVHQPAPIAGTPTAAVSTMFLE